MTPPTPQEPSAAVEDAWWRDEGREGLEQLLYWVWDPIGVSSAYPDARDEYATYAARLEPLLRAGAGADEVERSLREAEERDIEASAGDARRRDAAERVVDWYGAAAIRLAAEERAGWR
ncbi:hypothetical protein [Miltoncostaea marina]|uniref:hypothetical protein n=1 Tax=Miltoncostaea marina TaxID=2843215 RepID=UPI001C3CD124|nr:hypothetical protein [Miltoncostaea marina]